MKPKNLTGQRFGKLVAVKMVGSKSGHSLWLCRCDCGNEHTTTSACLRQGNVSSCGCIQKEIMEKRKDSIIGKRFGRLVVLKKSKTKNNKSYWECQCDCGNICVVSRSNLKGGVTKSCGCLADEIKKNCEIKNRKHNTFEIKGNIVYVDIENPMYADKKIICDLEDWENGLKDYFWNVDNNGYACSRNGRIYSPMHKMITGSNNNFITDHINQNGLDNRKENLRKTDYSINAFNRKTKKNSVSGYNGVWKNKKSGKWVANITVRGKRMHLGYFLELEDAIEARKEAEIKYIGELSKKE